MCCLAKEHVEHMETSSADALLFVTFNKRFFAGVKPILSRLNLIKVPTLGTF